MPKCFPADTTPIDDLDSPRLWYPYGVPNVTVQPAHALPECKVNEPYTPYGCHSNIPHCITQIKPETLLKGFHILKKRIKLKNIEPCFIH